MITTKNHSEAHENYRKQQRGVPSTSSSSSRLLALNMRFLFTQTQLLGHPMPEQFAARYQKKALSNQASS
jgi:hypothetical protein